MTRNICIIPARGGSKRIPRKNIRYFLGRPIIAYSIEAALKSNLFEEVMVSTDDHEIAEIAARCGAQVPFMRDSETASDFATSFEVLKEVIERYKSYGKEFENLCCIYPCAPFVSSQALADGLTLLIDQKYDTVFPIVEFGIPIQKSLIVEEGCVKFRYPEFALTRSQDLQKSYYDAGQFYWANTKAILKSGKVLTDNTGGIMTPGYLAQDIDNEEDWQIAELKYQLRRS